MQKSIQRLVKALQKELSDIERELDETVQDSPIWRAKEDLMVSVKGIGTVIARTLLADLPEAHSSPRGGGTLRGRGDPAAPRGVRLAPFTQQSGQWKGKAAIAGGRSIPRAALFMGAMVAVRHDPTLKAFYEHLIAAGKSKMVALIAAARKLLTILNAILRDNKPWQTA